MIQYLPFEKPIEALDKHVAELSAHAEGTEEARMLAERAERLRNMPTRLVLSPADVDAAIAAGRDAAQGNAALKAYLAARRSRP